MVVIVIRSSFRVPYSVFRVPCSRVSMFPCFPSVLRGFDFFCAPAWPGLRAAAPTEIYRPSGPGCFSPPEPELISHLPRVVLSPPPAPPPRTARHCVTRVVHHASSRDPPAEDIRSVSIRHSPSALVSRPVSHSPGGSSPAPVPAASRFCTTHCCSHPAKPALPAAADGPARQAIDVLATCTHRAVGVRGGLRRMMLPGLAGQGTGSAYCARARALYAYKAAVGAGRGEV
ncbi:hypothetical protein CALCODRAFT_103794 [Calocera cornea HHB12733]|uniref:Uncharacterized protein n=1 Tax=Calocera cornea HHB12733 TaxID=1353952 RepID=A0A165D4X4_9BASI|nr:hypothetical protein CALCODRAFT_103794 [Calocera cornea HHB12733]